MGSGLAGGPLTGGLTTAALPPAPAGQSAVLSGPLGAGATDVVTKIGSTEVDASVNAAAKLASFRTGISGTEVEKAWFIKDGSLGNLSGRFIGASPVNGYVWVSDAIGAALLNYGSQRIIITTAGITIDSSSTGIAKWRVDGGSGTVSIYGTDSSGTPGAATINKPTGKSAIAAGAASVVITNSLVTAATRVMITPETRDATCKELIAVPGAGSFTVSGSAVATATLVFSWEVSNIL